MRAKHPSTDVFLTAGKIPKSGEGHDGGIHHGFYGSGSRTRIYLSSHGDKPVNGKATVWTLLIPPRSRLTSLSKFTVHLKVLAAVSVFFCGSGVLVHNLKPNWRYANDSEGFPVWSFVNKLEDRIGADFFVFVKTVLRTFLAATPAGDGFCQSEINWSEFNWCCWLCWPVKANGIWKKWEKMLKITPIEDHQLRWLKSNWRMAWKLDRKNCCRAGWRIWWKNIFDGEEAIYWWSGKIVSVKVHYNWISSRHIGGYSIQKIKVWQLILDAVCLITCQP